MSTFASVIGDTTCHEPDDGILAQQWRRDRLGRVPESPFLLGLQRRRGHVGSPVIGETDAIDGVADPLCERQGGAGLLQDFLR